MLNRRGFTLVELLVVLVIIGILAAVATPLYIQHTQRARAAEAVATMSLLRQAMRDYKVNRTNYFNINEAETSENGVIQEPTPNTASPDGTPDPTGSGLGIDVGVAQYFSNKSFAVFVGDKAKEAKKAPFKNPNEPVEFLIRAKGSLSNPCEETDSNCAVRADEVKNYVLEMDNSGRIFVLYDGDVAVAKNWTAY